MHACAVVGVRMVETFLQVNDFEFVSARTQTHKHTRVVMFVCVWVRVNPACSKKEEQRPMSVYPKITSTHTTHTYMCVNIQSHADCVPLTLAQLSFFFFLRFSFFFFALKYNVLWCFWLCISKWVHIHIKNEMPLTRATHKMKHLVSVSVSACICIFVSVSTAIETGAWCWCGVFFSVTFFYSFVHILCCFLLNSWFTHALRCSHRFSFWPHEEQPEQRKVPKANERVIIHAAACERVCGIDIKSMDAL